MHSFRERPVHVLLLLASAALFLVGCDTAGTSTGPDGPNVLLRVTNDLGDRLETFGGSDGSNVISMSGSKAKSLTLRAVSRITPPNQRSGTSASHLSMSGEDIFVGYKIPGAPFGGGIDILDRQTPARLTGEDDALVSTVLDVQELAYDESTTPNNLFIAGAVDFGRIPARDYGNTPAVLIRAQIDDDGHVETNDDGDVRVVEARMPHNLVKSVALSVPRDTNHDVYAVTDGDSFFEFDGNLGSRNEVTGGVLSGVAFNTVDAFAPTLSARTPTPPNPPLPPTPRLRINDDATTLTKDGEIIKIDRIDTASPTRVSKKILPSIGENEIARLTTVTHTRAGADFPVHNPQLTYVALGEEGFRVLDAAGGTVRFDSSTLPSRNQATIVSLTVHENDAEGVDRLFAAGPNGTIDVFQVTEKIRDGDTSTGLSLQASFSLGGLEEVGVGFGGIGDAQVNQILATDDHLFVAASTEGVITLEIVEDGSSIY